MKLLSSQVFWAIWDWFNEVVGLLDVSMGSPLLAEASIEAIFKSKDSQSTILISIPAFDQ